MATSAQHNQLYLTKARNSTDSKDCMSIYDKWASSYNDEVGDEAQNYVAPALVAQAALKSTNDPARSVMLDAGCGTGLVGQALAIGGAKIIDGLDLSAPMLKIADQTGVFRHTYQADMSKPLDLANETYDIVTCVGTFTMGHVGPDPALHELIRITKRNGVIVSTILEEIWKAQGFDKLVKQLKEDQIVTVESDDLVDYVKGHGDKAIMLVLRKNELPN